MHHIHVNTLMHYMVVFSKYLRKNNNNNKILKKKKTVI